MGPIAILMVFLAAQAAFTAQALADDTFSPQETNLEIGAANATRISASLSATVNASGSVDFAVLGRVEAASVRLGSTNESNGSALNVNPRPPPAADPVVKAVAVAIGVSILIAIVAALKLGAAGSLGIGLFSRIDGNRLLEHDVRRRIHACILANPGITITEIATSSGSGWGTTNHHVRRLERGGFIVSQRHRQYRRFYDAKGGLARDLRSASAELIHPTSERIASEVVHHPGAAQQAVAQAAGVSAAVAHKYLGRLERAQLLTRERDAKWVRYFPTIRLKEMLPAETTTPMVAA